MRRRIIGGPWLHSAMLGAAAFGVACQVHEPEDSPTNIIAAEQASAAPTVKGSTEPVSTDLEIPPEPDDATLAQFMADSPERYAGPPRFDFELVTVLRTPKDTDNSRGQAALASLRAGAEPTTIKGRYTSGAGLTMAEIGQTYGMELGAAVTELPPDEWGLVQFEHGWTLVHLLAQHAGDTPPLQTVRDRVKRDWQQSHRGTTRRARPKAQRREPGVPLAR